MAITITSAVCASYKSEVLQGTHASGDTYKLLLLKSSASGSGNYTYAFTNVGTPGTGTPSNSNVGTDEVAAGNGYTSGGVTLSAPVVGVLGQYAYLTFGSGGSADASWPASTITACGAVIYNSSKGNKAVAVLGFSSTGTAQDKSSSNGTFTVDIGNATYTANTIAFVAPNQITDSANGFITAGFQAGHSFITNDATNPGPFTIASVTAGTITITGNNITSVSSGSSKTLQEFLICW